MAYVPLINLVPQFFDNLGDPLVGGTLNAYVAGTSTPTNMFADNAGTVAGTSVTLDSRGEPTTIKLIWLDDTVTYKFILKDSTGSTIWTEDNIVPSAVTDGSITSSKLANGAVISSKIADSAVTTSKISNASITPEKLISSGYELGRRNILINGAMHLAQRGTGFNPASGFTLDRWFYNSSGSGAVSLSRIADVPTGMGYLYSLLIGPVTADTSIAAGDYYAVRQLVEGYDILPLVGRTFTLSFWVKSSKTGVHCVAFKNRVSTKSYIAEYTVNAANTWEYKTITVTNGLQSGGWDFTNDVGLQVIWTLAAGSTYQTTASTWASGNYLATANQVNCLDNTSNLFGIVGTQLEIGSSATPFEYRNIAEETMLCHRFYEKGAGQYYLQTTLNYVVFSFSTRKRITPTMSYTASSGTGGTLVASDDSCFMQSTTHSALSLAAWTADSEFTYSGA